MIDRVERVVRGAQAWISRSEWAIRLLRLTTAEPADHRPGLLIIQIDGLSRTQLQRAMSRGRMPFLRRLLEREQYQLHGMYSGLPASTPAVQAEMFYGVPTAVPAFCFLDRPTGHLFKMYHPKPAAEIERRLERQAGPGLLAGGSAYADIFHGGAAEPHYCAAGTKWGRFFRTLHPLILPWLLIIHPDVVLRLIWLLLIESMLAVWDCFRGIISGITFFEEFGFIMTRVAFCILLRELVTIGAKIDVERGLQIVHVNFIGYDEQAHRRGPSSAFAHWALAGIDAAIARIWASAARSSRRHYDLWVYSDHGQEEAIPYPVLHGRTMESAVEALFERLQDEQAVAAKRRDAAAAARTRYMAGRVVEGWRSVGHAREEGRDKRRVVVEPMRGAPEPEGQLIVTGMGSLGHIYPPKPLDEAARQQFGEQLVKVARIPMVLAAAEPGAVWVWNEAGRFRLPEDAATIFGPDYPHLQDVAADFVRLCHHQNAGAFVISGWRKGTRIVSFPLEHGTHTGPGTEETNAFLLLPADAPLAPPVSSALRPRHLRQAVQRFLHRPVDEEPVVEPQPATGLARADTCRIMTYNVHSCRGMDGRLSPERIARVIARYNPDIVALQELDVGRARTGGIDQAQLIAQRLKMLLHFSPSLRIAEEQYGNAVLSRFPMVLMRAEVLPGKYNWPDPEPRSALWVRIEIDGRPIQLITSHLSIWPRRRALEAAALLGDQWLNHPDCQGVRVLCGDLNAAPASPVCRRIGRCLKDAQLAVETHRPQPTWSGRYRLSRIDHIFVGEEVPVINVMVPNDHLTRVASDHLPLIVDIRLPR